MLREFIKGEILLMNDDLEVHLSDLEMKQAIDGVEYWIMSELNASIDISVDNVLNDRNKSIKPD